MSDAPHDASVVGRVTHREYLISQLQQAIEHLRDERTVVRGSDVRTEKNHRFVRDQLGDDAEDVVTLLPADTLSGHVYLQYEIPIPEADRAEPQRINPRVAGHEQVAVVGEDETPVGTPDDTDDTDETDE